MKLLLVASQIVEPDNDGRLFELKQHVAPTADGHGWRMLVKWEKSTSGEVQERQLF